MQPSDFIFRQVYNALKNKGCPEIIAHREAVTCLDSYNKGRIGKKTSDLIEKHVKQGLKDAKSQMGIARLKKAEAEAAKTKA